MNIKKTFYITIGCVGVALGAVGAALPLIPAFPFLMLSAYCFGKSSKKLNNWFVGTKLYQNNLASFVKGKGMTKKAKLRIMGMVTFTMGFGFFMMKNTPIGRSILTAVWIFHILYFIFGIKTISSQENAHFLESLSKKVSSL